MSQSTEDLTTWVLGTMISLSVVMGLLVRYVLVPYLRDHLVTPMREVRKQVTENHHSNVQPTVLDRIDDVSRQVTDLADEVRDMQKGYTALASGLGGHLVWSENEVSRLWEVIRAKGQRG